MSATASDTVTLEIDGRDLTVPKGTPLVIAAAEAGIEIPVFCYEPRLGPAVGACRMCLVEIEGMPKLQAACTMTATDGMKVHTRSDKAAQGQSAVLEFILLNHPLDCPVCDKGGECPLQDLTYRYGPGNTRFHLPKRTYEKPIPVSPLIALDRERCILCYRCTRFSQDVAEDEQLVARERGASSIIATFEDQPYVGPFSGNVIELCPVGALTSTEYRFNARPWEITNVPTVCGLSPMGCNTWATVREERVQRVLSRNHAEVDEGWLCDKGRFARQHLNAADRYRAPLIRGERGLDDASWEAAAETIALRLRHFSNLYGPGSIAIVASGEQSNEEAYLWSAIAEQVGGALLVSRDGAGAGRLAPYAATVADVDRADLIVVAGDRELGDAAGVLELRVLQAVRGGANLVVAGVGGTRLDRNATERIPTPAGHVATAFHDVAPLLAAAERPVLIATDPLDERVVARLAHDAAMHAKPGGVLAIPSSPNGRGVQLAGFDGEPAAALAGEVRLLVVLGDVDPIASWPQSDAWRQVLQQAESVIAVTMFPNEVTGWAHVIVPATAALEKEGTLTNLEGRTQRLRPALPAPDGIVPEIAWLAAVAQHVGLDVEGYAPTVNRRMVGSRPGFAGVDWAEAGDRAPLAKRTPGQTPDPGTATMAAPPAPGGLRVAATRPLFAGRAVEHTQRLAFQRPGDVVVSLEDARGLELRDGQTVRVDFEGGSVTGPVRTSRTLAKGAVRVAWDGPPVDSACEIVVVDSPNGGPRA